MKNIVVLQGDRSFFCKRIGMQNNGKINMNSIKGKIVQHIENLKDQLREISIEQEKTSRLIPKQVRKENIISIS